MLDVIRDYTVGWICANSADYLAAQEFLDEEYGRPEWRFPNDTNSYYLGAIGKHKIVLAVLPMGEYGTASAAAVAVNMLRSFPKITIGLMVGNGGGAPLPTRDIRLGDVVVGYPKDGSSGVFQYDLGKRIQEKSFQHTRSLSQPPDALLIALGRLKAQHEREGNRILEEVDEILAKKPRLRGKYGRPPPETDILFKSNFVHHGEECPSSCGRDSSNIIQRQQRIPGVDDDPAVHYGVIGSGNTLMKDALMRDLLAKERNVLCFENEAAGLMNLFPCLVIRGICNYSDSHKSDEWHGFAAMTAAAFTKELIRSLVPEMPRPEPRMRSI